MDSSEPITTRDGAELLVRPIAPTDRAAFLEAFEHLSGETRYRRFLAPIRHLTESEVAYLTEVDHRDHEALIAVNSDGEIVGVARYVRYKEAGNRAEVAVTVADVWQGRGVGTALLARLADRASSAGIGSLVGICLSGNTDMQQLLVELGPGARVSAPQAGLVEVEARLPAADDRHQELASALRAAAVGHEQAKKAHQPRPDVSSP